MAELVMIVVLVAHWKENSDSASSNFPIDNHYKTIFEPARSECS